LIPRPVLSLFAWHDNHHHQIDKDAWHATGDQRDQECEAKPESAYAEKFGQSAAYAGHHAIAF
jgi:hypothetical protein